MKMHFMRCLVVLVISALIVPSLDARQPVYSRKSMVVAQEDLATEVGVSVLRSGGNAVDAAVAVGFALAVTHPFAGNIGGGGFMLIRMADGRTTFIDFREKAPSVATHDMYLNASGVPTTDSLVGWRAAGVPGTVRGFELANKKYGRKPWIELLKPAVTLAARGFLVSKWQMDSWQRSSPLLSHFPESNRIFLKGGAYYEQQETFKQPELARTLDRIAHLGAADFYDGETAHILANEMAKNGGLITLADMHNYQAVERTPLEGHYKGYHIITSPPPSSGGVGLLQMLAMLNATGYEKFVAGSAESYHYIAEVMRRYFADRSKYLGDPDFVNNPISALLAPAYIQSRRATIDPERATPSEQISPGLAAANEGSDTTHYSIVDEQGNAVAVTYTLNNGYGSGVTVPGAGFLLNDEMDDFAAKPGEPNMFGLIQGEANSVAPHKRPLSAMTPTLVLKDQKLILAVGSPGGPTIINTVLQVILNVFDYHMNIQQAVNAPRLHHQWMPDVIAFEPFGISEDVRRALDKEGHHFADQPGYMGDAEAVMIDQETGLRWGASDPRNADSAALGY
jgi:gamma-glutamyltranspeptidase/glutathione hydrolase